MESSKTMGVQVRPFGGQSADLTPDKIVLTGSLRAKSAAEVQQRLIEARLEPFMILPDRGWLLGYPSGRPWCRSYTKRVLDILMAALILTLAAPLLLLIAVAVKLDTPGPVLFMQPRTGQRGRRFRMFKFRTMVADAEDQKESVRELSRHGQESPDFKIAEDPRVTYVGWFLRRFSLDELPNLVNVIRGEMSLVGPRPTSFDLDSYEDSHLVRLAVRPGVTGLWQISGRSEVDFDERVAMDARYVDEQSPWLDLKILLVTPLRVLDGWGAC